MVQKLPFWIAVLACVPFLPAVRAGFVNLDDSAFLLSNPYFRGLNWAALRWMFTTTRNGPYQPLSWISYALDFLFYGLEPAGYHVTNLLFHAANAGLFFLVARRLLAAAHVDREPRRLDLAAAAAALLFAVHPLRVESVAWVSERRDVLSGFFYLLTVLFYIDRRRAPALAAFVLSLLAKGVGVSLPAVLVVLDVYPLRRFPDGPKREYWLEKWPYAAAAAACGAVGVWSQSQSAALVGLSRLGFSARLAEAAYGAVFYLWKTLLPAGLIPAYRIPADISLASPLFLSCALLVVGATAAAAVAAKRRPALAAAWFFYLLTLAPLLGLVKFGSALVADRYSYLACLGFALLAAGALARFLDRAAARAALAAWLLVMAAATWRQTTYWNDSVSLWSRDLAVDPDSGVARQGLGFSFAEEGRFEEAIAEYQRSLRLRPGNADTLEDLSDAWRALGVKFMRTGDARAAACFTNVLAMNPADANAHGLLAVVLGREGRLADAEAEARRAVELQPEVAAYRSNLSALQAALARKGRR